MELLRVEIQVSFTVPMEHFLKVVQVLLELAANHDHVKA
jgi:hypothetical protein